MRTSPVPPEGCMLQHPHFRLISALTLHGYNSKTEVSMLKKLLMTSTFGFVLAAGVAGAAEVVVRVAPPAAVVETRPVRPAAGYVWTPGYYRWDGHAHVWVGGAWVMPPRPHAVWVPHRWVHRHGGWVMVEGHWR
jgi:hypothetical protein